MHLKYSLEQVVENIMDKVKCGKGLVRECLAERRGSKEVFFIEQVRKHDTSTVLQEMPISK